MVAATLVPAAGNSTGVPSDAAVVMSMTGVSMS